MKGTIKEFLSNKKILPSLLLLFLMIGVGATIIAVQRSTEFRQQASTVQNENPYQVVPVIYLSSDFNSDITNYTKQVRDNFLEVAQWYKQKIDKTFNVAEPVVFKDTLTFSQILSKYPDASVGSTNGYFVKYEMPKALSSNGMDICDSTKIYYFVTPMNVNWGGSGGREFFGCERFPGYASIPGHMGRLIGGIIDPNWPEWWAVEPRQARGGVAHELTHLFGAYCDPTGCNLTPHNQDPNSVMNAWWDYEAPGKNVTIGPEELGYINKSSQIIFLSPPSVTPLIPTSTPTPTPTINPTTTPTPIQTLTITPILPTATPTRILTPTSSPSPTPMATTIQLTIGLDGIGNTGDNTNRIDTSAANPNPKRPKRDAEIEIFDVRNVKVDNYNGEIEYDPVTGFFTGGVKLYYIPSGDYIAKIKSTGYLTKTLPGIIHIVPGQKYTAPNMNLIAGDINGDNILNLSDYNILNDCIFSPAATHGTVCDQNPNYLINSDITDNGIKDIFDYNLFTRELTDRYGD